jgi:hypothetical protein
LRQTVAVVIISALLGSYLAGCATLTQTGAAAGAAVGAGVGAAAGGAARGSKGAVVGAVVGAGVGLIIGALVGRHFDQRTGDRVAAAKAASLTPSEGNIIDIRKYEVLPVQAKPGQIIVVRMDYFVLAPNPDQRVDLREWRVIRRDGQDVTQPDYRQLRVEQGTHTSEYRFRLLSNTPPGRYSVVTILKTEGEILHQKAAEAVLVVG